MSPAGPHRPCRPLTIYAYRRRSARVRRAWVWAMAFALVVSPRAIHTADAPDRLSKVGDLSWKAQSLPHSAPQIPIRLTSAQAEADVVTSAEIGAEADSSKRAFETRSAGSPKPQVARVVRSRRLSTKRHPDSTVKDDVVDPNIAAAPAPHRRAMGPGLTIPPK